MYKPKFNHVLVEIDDKDARWGTNEENIGGVVYREGVICSVGHIVPTSEYPLSQVDTAFITKALPIGQKVMWNEGHEAGTVHEDNGKKYALIFWWDVIGDKE